MYRQSVTVSAAGEWGGRVSERIQIGDATLYLGDCLDVLPTLPKVDVVIADPPSSRPAKLPRVAVFMAGNISLPTMAISTGMRLPSMPHAYS
jgi:hypothetical protein